MPRPTEDPWRMRIKDLVVETLPKHEAAFGPDRVQHVRAVLNYRTIRRSTLMLVIPTWLLAIATIVLAVVARCD